MYLSDVLLDSQGRRGVICMLQQRTWQAVVQGKRVLDASCKQRSHTEMLSLQVCKEVQESHGKLLKDWIKGIQGGWLDRVKDAPSYMKPVNQSMCVRCNSKQLAMLRAAAETIPSSTIHHLVSRHAMLCWLLCCAGNAKLADIRARVEAFASGFPMPGFDVDGLH
jgi:hypothetical protein